MQVHEIRYIDVNKNIQLEATICRHLFTAK